MEGFVVILAVILVAVFVAVLDWQGRRRREKELSAWAAGRGLRFNPEREPQFGTRYESFRALQRGSNRYAFNRITGSWGTHEFTGSTITMKRTATANMDGRRITTTSRP